MIKSFRDGDTRSLFERIRVPKLQAIERSALRKLEALNAATNLTALAAIPGNRLEPLKGSRQGLYSIRINDQWRVCFAWRDTDAYDVEIVDYH
ncbi:MAG: type II toxin-antitoxin system RelE/ParE family toxin [Candidatus Binataceae bacterium]